MAQKSIMVIAGEVSGDILAAELVHSLRRLFREEASPPTLDFQPLNTPLEPNFFGAGGPNLASAGVDLVVDMTQHSVVGLWEVVKKYNEFRRIFSRLVHLALTREPDAIICVDFSGFNLRLACEIRRQVRALRGSFTNWNPVLVQYVSPQVWASRPERARTVAETFDLLLSILPFETAWYRKRVPELAVEFVGHPLVDRYATQGFPSNRSGMNQRTFPGGTPPTLALLPGSRLGELQRHLPVLLGAFSEIRQAHPKIQATLVLPNEALAKEATVNALPPGLKVQVGHLETALADADVALASTGTVTLECALFGVPTVALYRTSWATYQVGKQLVQVNYLAMPNLMAGTEVFPEFIQGAATAENVAQAALELIANRERRQWIQSQLEAIVRSLGCPGASRRAALAVFRLIRRQGTPLRAHLNP